MILSQERLWMIECLSMDLLREIYAKNEDIIPPIDLNKIVEKARLKIMVGEASNPNLAGIYHRQEGLIIVKKNDPRFRKVFTVAQAVGHHYLHGDKAPSETFY